MASNWLANTIRGLSDGAASQTNANADEVRALLVNAGRDEPWDCRELRPLDFLTPDGAMNRLLLEDADAHMFLFEPLSTMRAMGIDLAPMKTKGDGNCLVNAVSRCLVGHEIFNDALRTAMHRELCTHREFYALARAGFDDEEGSILNGDILHAREPGVYLGQVHEILRVTHPLPPHTTH
jgi:hypothetical protein